MTMINAGTGESPVIPKQWKDLGYSGLFIAMIRMVNTGTEEPADPERVAIQQAKVPYELTPGWLALAIEPHEGYPHMVLVRRDDAAVSETIFKGGLPR